MNDVEPKSPNRASHARWLAAAVVIVAILLGSLLPGGVLIVPIDLAPAVKHLIAYGVLGLLLVLATGADWRKTLIIAAVLAGLGLLIEIAQIFIPDRSFLAIDILAGGLGALAGAILGRFLLWFIR